MDDEKKELELKEELLQQEAEGKQMEFEVEKSFEEMEEGFEEEAVVVKEKRNFWKELSHQAVCKIFFLFAGIGFFFPFFTIACQGKSTGLITKGFEMFFNYKIPIQQGMDMPVAAQPLMIAAFAVIVIGLILTVGLRGMARNISGAVCSIIVVVIMAVFAIILPQAIIDTIKSFAATVGMGDPSQLGDLSVIKPVFEAGFYFVNALMAINFIYFIVQIAIESKRRSKEVMEFDGDALEETDFENADVVEAEIVEEPDADVDAKVEEDKEKTE